MLRSDVQRSRVLLPGRFPGIDKPLNLRLPDGRQVRYEWSLGQLLRVIRAADGHEIGRRTVLADVTVWDWTEIAPGLVEIELSYQRPRNPSSRGLAGVRRLRRRGLVTQTIRLRFALRARPGGRTW
jgi:hypothetical protein